MLPLSLQCCAESLDTSAPAVSDFTCDVAIVGAGISGLALARYLVEAGLDVVVFEGRDRVGGRLHSVGGLDLGATWFWPNEPRVQALIRDLGVLIHAQHLDGDAVYHDPSGMHRLDGNPLDVRSGRFVAGADSLPLAIARELPNGVLRLPVTVKAITHVDDTVTLTTSEGGVVARTVVLALPPALAVASIHIDPPLPEAVAGAARSTPVWMGAFTKVVARYPDAFWRRAGLSGSGISHVGPMHEVHDMSGVDGVPGAFFGFVPARRAGEPTVSEAAIVNQLVTMFGPEAGQPDAIHVCDWRAEPFTSPPAVEQLTASEMFGHQALQNPSFDGRLYWTSTETAGAFPGHIEGALEAAERTARQLKSRTP
jgi:monoamine oxidase